MNKLLSPVLVTGSAGQLGRELVALLRQRGYRVVGADLLPGPTTDLVLDVRQEEAVNAAVQGMTAVIHTAALHGRHLDLQVPRLDFVHTNIVGTLHLLNACTRHGVAKFLYTSTTSIYGHALVDPKQAVWVEETLPPVPRDIYDITKQAAENLCRDFFEREGLQTVVLRVGRFLPEPPNLACNHRLYRGLDPRDGAAGLVLALEQQAFATCEVFNLAAGSPFQPADLAQLQRDPRPVIAHRLVGAEAAYQRLGWAFPTSIDRVYSIEKARRVLGYAPRYTAAYLLHEAVAALG